jgi:uncharacterized membrane protein
MNALERTIGKVLRIGVAASSACLAAGLALSLLGVAPGVGSALLQIGILVLLCTPAARVVISTIEYVSQRDWPFATLTAIVLLELLGSVVAALLFNRRL